MLFTSTDQQIIIYLKSIQLHLSENCLCNFFGKFINDPKLNVTMNHSRLRIFKSVQKIAQKLERILHTSGSAQEIWPRLVGPTLLWEMFKWNTGPHSLLELCESLTSFPIPLVRRYCSWSLFFRFLMLAFFALRLSRPLYMYVMFRCVRL